MRYMAYENAGEALESSLGGREMGSVLQASDATTARRLGREGGWVAVVEVNDVGVVLVPRRLVWLLDWDNVHDSHE